MVRHEAVATNPFVTPKRNTLRIIIVFELQKEFYISDKAIINVDDINNSRDIERDTNNYRE
jgi:hypothetical protein